MRYDVESDNDLDELKKKVNDKLAHGYELVGGIAVTSTEYPDKDSRDGYGGWTMYLQAVVLR